MKAVLIHQLRLDAAFATVRSAATGLSQADAAARRHDGSSSGPTRIERLAPTPAAVTVLRGRGQLASSRPEVREPRCLRHRQRAPRRRGTAVLLLCT